MKGEKKKRKVINLGQPVSINLILIHCPNNGNLIIATYLYTLIIEDILKVNAISQ